MFAEIALLLYLGHLLADHPLQTDHQASCKAEAGWAGWAANLRHAGTHVVACGVLLGVGALLLGWDLPPLAAGAALLWIGATHAFIDRRWPVAWWMRNARQSRWAEHGGAAHVDQTAHITALVIAALALAVI